MKHTPGPWRHLQSAQTRIMIDAPAHAEQFRASVRIMHGYPQEALANARLIAAAPELLDALKGILAITDRKHVTWDKARAAIGKAEGREVQYGEFEQK